MKLQSIQILRGMAALLVVIYHIRAMEILAIGKNDLQELPLLNGFISNGYAGVDLFFVISGSLPIVSEMLHLLDKGVSSTPCQPLPPYQRYEPMASPVLLSS